MFTMNEMEYFFVAVVAFVLCPDGVFHGNKVMADFGVQIVHGENADIADNPWQVSIQVQVSPGKYLHSCGGVIISKKWILTAAHCGEHYIDGFPCNTTSKGIDTNTKGQNSKRRNKKRRNKKRRNRKRQKNNKKQHNFCKVSRNLRIGVGNSKLSEMSVYRFIRRFYVHQDFTKLKILNDIALMELTKPLEFGPGIEKIDLAAPGSDFERHVCKASGWGLNRLKGEPDNLQVINTAVYPHDNCRKIMKRFFPILDSQVCVKDRRGFRSGCKGDSGGPFSCKVRGRDVLVGIFSFSEPGCRGVLPQVMSSVSFYNSWINSITGPL